MSTQYSSRPTFGQYSLAPTWCPSAFSGQKAKKNQKQIMIAWITHDKIPIIVPRSSWMKMSHQNTYAQIWACVPLMAHNFKYQHFSISSKYGTVKLYNFCKCWLNISKNFILWTLSLRKSTKLRKQARGEKFEYLWLKFSESAEHRFGTLITY